MLSSRWLSRVLNFQLYALLANYLKAAFSSLLQHKHRPERIEIYSSQTANHSLVKIGLRKKRSVSVYKMIGIMETSHIAFKTYDLKQNSISH